jgi:hypothetical protein
MFSFIAQALKYWFGAVIRPRKVFADFKENPDKVSVAFIQNFIFAFLYTITAFLLSISWIVPIIKPWMPIPEADYYFSQIFWTIPWALATWILQGGIAHLISLIGRKDANDLHFEDALAVTGIAWILPGFFLMWIPETLILIPFKILPSGIIETVRLMILAPLWQIVLSAIGLHETHRISWIKGALIGIINVGIYFLMFLAFMR